MVVSALLHVLCWKALSILHVFLLLIPLEMYPAIQNNVSCRQAILISAVQFVMVCLVYDIVFVNYIVCVSARYETSVW